MRDKTDIIEDGKATRFSSDNQPAGRGRPKGSKNRSTVLKAWLETKIEITNPFTNETETVTVEDDIVLALIAKARNGDVTAYKEIMDSAYGKIKEKQDVELALSSEISMTEEVRYKIVAELVERARERMNQKQLQPPELNGA